MKCIAKSLLCIAAAFAAGAAAQIPSTGSGQAYPVRAIRVIIPAGAGDSCDVLSRLVGYKAGEKLGQQFAIDNRPGAGGQLGLQMIAKAPPDGYTLGCGQGGNMVIVPIAYKKVEYDTHKDFIPIALMASNFLALVVHPTVPFKNTGELIAYARANPAKLSFGTTGEGAFLHFATELLRTRAGFTYLHVPYKTYPNVVTDLMGGRLDASLGSFIGIQPHVVSRRLRLLGIARATRAPNYPDFPTIAESVPGYASGGWFGLIAPAGTPKDIVTQLNREFNAAMKLPDVREKMTAYGLEIHTETPEYFTETIRRDFELWGKVARDIGFKPQ